MIFLRRNIVLSLLAIIVANLAMIFIAVAQYPALFSQPGARIAVLEPVSVLVAYVVAVVWIGRTRGTNWDMIIRSATLYGLLGGTLEVLNIGIENGIPVAIHTPALTIGFMLTIFSSWGVAGFRTARSLKSIRAGTASEDAKS